MRTHITKDTDFAIEYDDRECFAEEFDSLRAVVEGFEASDRMPEPTQFG